jgi:hypothetical protein
MKQFIVLVSTICLGILIATFVMGFKTNAQTLNTTATNSLQSLSISSSAPNGN